MKSYLGVPMLPVRVSLTTAVLSMGSLLGTLCLGAWPAASPWTNCRNIRVFLAAPINSTRTGPETRKSVNWKLPPPYLNTGPLSTQRTHSTPSIGKATPPIPTTPKSLKCWVIGGTVGTPPSEIPHIRRPTASQERSRKKKSACCVRNDK
jgi:hypothetical protein